MQAASRDETIQATLEAASQFRLPEPVAPAVWSPRRRDHVTAVLVVHNGMKWLPRVLDSLAASQSRPDRVVAVDTGSSDGSDRLLADSPVIDSTITLPAKTGFGGAIAAAEESLPTFAADTAEAGGAVEWLWLLHDDCAPEPAALATLLDAAQRGDAAVAGPKARGWHDQGLLIECGLSVTNSGRRYTGLEAGDRDQGQRDDISDVLAVGSAGMLVRRDIWQRLGGFDAALPMYGDDVEFCMRVRRADERVLVVPEAVIHHREAARHGLRRQQVAEGDQQVAERKAALYTTLVHGPGLLLPLTSLVLLVRSLLSSLVILLSDGPSRAVTELRIWAGVHLHPVRVLRARWRLRRTATVPRRDLRDLRPGRLEQWSAAFDHSAAGVVSSLRSGAGGPPLAMGHALLVCLLLAAVALAATRSIWMSSGPLSGGALLPAMDGPVLWDAFRASWHDVGLGSAEPAAAYPLALIVAAAPPLVSVPVVVQTILLLAVPLAGLSAFLALRGLPSRHTRAILAFAYGLTPAAVAPSLDGRLATAATAVLLPWLVRLIVRIFAGHDLAGVLPAPRVRTVATAALLLAVLASFAPLLWAAAAVAVLITALARARDARTWVWSVVLIALPVALLWPWSLSVLTNPERAMFEAGVTSPQLVAQTPPTWRLLLLDPGTLGANVLPVAAGLVAAAVLGLLLRRSRGMAVWGWFLVAIGLIGATAQTSMQFVPLGGTTAQYGFAGPMLHLMALGMVLAAAALVRNAEHRARAGERVLVVLAFVGLLAGPLVLGALWATQLTGPLQRNDASVVPAFVVDQAVSAAAVRTLLLQTDEDGAVAYTLVNGEGGKLGDADVAPPAQSWREISTAVAGLAAGVGPEPVAVLAGNAVKYIVADNGDVALAAALDGNSGLRRLSTTNGRGLWLVDGLASRARLIGSAGAEQEDVLPAQQWDGGTLVSTEVDPGADGAQFVLAQTDDGRWSVVVGGKAIQTQPGPQVSFAVPGGSAAAVEVSRDQNGRHRQLLIAFGALLFLVLLMLPRGHLSPPPDPDAGDDDAAGDPGEQDHVEAAR